MFQYLEGVCIFLAVDVYRTIDDIHHNILKQLEKKLGCFSKKLDQMIPHGVNNI